MTASASASTANRDAATVTAWNLVSRATGLGRVIVLGGALGVTRLGDTYQASNQLSNVLFELLVAGTLSAILVPALVGHLATDDVASARAFAGLVLGRLLLVVTPLVGVGLIFAEPIMRLVFAGNNTSSRNAQVHLGVFLLFFVLPQLVLYAWGALVTALLHADGRFGAAAMAPVANNVVVIAGLGWFWARGVDGLALSVGDKWVLGATALGGVLAMTLIPAVAAGRAGLGVTPRLGRRDEKVGLGRDALWASCVIVPTQVVAFASIVVASRASGGVAAYQIAFSLFLLPHALVGHPVATVLYPRLSSASVGRDTATVRRLGGSGVEVVGGVLCVAAALAAALGPWLVRVVAVGEFDARGGVALTATALAWLAVGLPAYAWVLLLVRISYARGDRTRPAVAAIVGGAAAGAVLLVASQAATDRNTVAFVCLAHSLMASVTAVMLLVGNATSGVIEVPVMRLVRYVGVAIVAGGAARLVAQALPGDDGRVSALSAVAGGALAGTLTYVVGLYACGQRFVPRLVAA